MVLNQGKVRSHRSQEGSQGSSFVINRVSIVPKAKKLVIFESSRKLIMDSYPQWDQLEIHTIFPSHQCPEPYRPKGPLAQQLSSHFPAPGPSASSLQNVWILAPQWKPGRWAWPSSLRFLWHIQVWLRTKEAKEEIFWVAFCNGRAVQFSSRNSVNDSNVPATHWKVGHAWGPSLTSSLPTNTGPQGLWQESWAMSCPGPLTLQQFARKWDSTVALWFFPWTPFRVAPISHRLGE